MGEKEDVKFVWLPFLRQLMISSGVWTSYFLLGLCTGAPTVMVPQLRRDTNSTGALSDEMASWLPAIFSYSGIPWILILPIAITIFGRKLSHAFICATTLIGFIVLYFSQTIVLIVISEIAQGALFGAYLTINILLISEYTSSKYRGIFLTIKSATFFWGVLVSNAVGTFFHWKNIAILGLLCSVYKLVTIFFWIESPLWLASKGKFEECAKAHRWLKGSDPASERELQRLLAQYESKSIKKMSFKASLKSIFKTATSWNFIKPNMLCLLVLGLHIFSGKMVITVYALDIIKKMTKSQNTAYLGMLILDVITVLCMYLGCFVAKVLQRRTILLTGSFVAIIFLLLTSLYLYLLKQGIIVENIVISLLLLSGFSVSIGSGPMIMCTTIVGELVPLDSRSLSICIIALIFKIVYATVIKVAPYSFKTLGMHGTYLFFGLSSSFFLLLVYLYLPETKDKTLQEIDDVLKGKKPCAENKELLPDKHKIEIRSRP